MLYFAYGSNMDGAQMKNRCPSAHKIKLGVLRDYRLAFTYWSERWKCATADVVTAQGFNVYGVLYELSDEDFLRLDRFEGTPTCYRRVQQRVSGKLAVAYEVVHKRNGIQPSASYMAQLICAADDLPRAYRRMLRTTQTTRS